MSDDPLPTGRARGRARGRDITTTGVENLTLGAGRGRGRGSSVEMKGKGRGETSLSSLSSGSGSGSGGSSSPPSSSEGIIQPLLGKGGTRKPTRGIRPRHPLKLRVPDLDTKKGAGGTPIDLLTNYFSLVQKPEWSLYQYSVKFSPNIEDNRVKKAMVYQHEDILGKFMTDGMVLNSIKKLSTDDSAVQLTSTKREDGSKVNIVIKYVGQILPSDYAYVQFFNILLRNAMEKLQLELIRRDYYDPKAAVDFKAYRLELWPGYMTSIRQHEVKVMLCCELSNKILRTDTVLDQMAEAKKRGGNSFKVVAEKMVLGAIVMTRYNNKTYRIDEIAWDKTPSDEFEGRNGEKLSYMKYYAEKYNRTIKDTKQPLLISIAKVRDERSGQTGPVYLVPELCNMTGLSEDQRSNFQLMKALGAYTRQEPKKRMETLMKFSQRINSQPEIKKDLEAWGLEFSNELESFKGRVLPPEKILGAKSSTATYQLDNADWSKCFRKWDSYKAVSLSKWVVICGPKDEAQTKDFLASLKKVVPSLGMTIKEPRMTKMPDTRAATYLSTLDQILPAKPQLVMLVVPNNRGDQYAAIKKKCCLDVPTPSQVITATVLNKPKGLMSVATKVAIQMNCKLGGEPWAVKMPLKNSMVIGYDTYHDTVNKGKSVGALVASLNESMTKYISIANMHTNPDQELHDNLCPAIVTALRKYQQLNAKLPEKIILYRDGVGDGQIPYVVDHEVDAIQKTLEDCGLKDDLKFAFIIVNKRINTKFIQKTSSNHVNPPSGTIVDDVVTLPERYDFFLISQSVTQGTVNPTSYNVVKDTSGLSPEYLQKLTYKLAHLYYNWPGTVRVPAPCQYAHKLAYLVGETLHRSPDGAMGDLLYYL